MKKMKKVITAAVALMMTAALAATAYAADYGDTVTAPAVSSSSTESAGSTEDDAAVSAKLDDAITNPTTAEDGTKAAVVEVDTLDRNFSIKPSALKELKAEGVLKITSKEAEVEIDPATITKARKVDLSMKVYGSKTRSVVDFKSSSDFGCEVKVTVKNCKMTVAKLKTCSVYCDGEVVADTVEINENNKPVITVTKGGTYEIK